MHGLLPEMQSGGERARINCGNRSAAITEVYSDLDPEKATEVIARIGWRVIDLSVE